MAWTGDTFTALLTLPELHAVYTDLTAAFAQQSGSPPLTGPWSHGGSLDVRSTLTVGGLPVLTGGADAVESLALFNASSGFNLRGFPTKQLLQRVFFQDTTSRGSTSTVFSTYAVASITPVSSSSTVLVRAGVYYGLASLSAGLEAEFASHLLRNPKVVPTSFAYLTNCSAPLGGNIGQPMGGAVAGGTGVAVLGEISGLMAFEAVDSVTTLDPRQYGIDWSTASGTGTACIAGGYITIEEWL